DRRAQALASGSGEAVLFQRTAHPRPARSRAGATHRARANTGLTQPALTKTPPFVPAKAGTQTESSDLSKTGPPLWRGERSFVASACARGEQWRAMTAATAT